MFAQDFLRRSGNKSAPEAVTFHNPAKHGFEALSTNIILICRKMVFMLGVQLGFSNYIQTNSKHKLMTPLNNNQTMRQERWNGMEQSLKTAAPPTKEGETGERGRWLAINFSRWERGSRIITRSLLSSRLNDACTTRLNLTVTMRVAMTRPMG